jgi:predicted MFS family arabinose efflux permease
MSRDLILIGLSLFTWGLGESTFFYFQPLYLQQLGADPVYIGIILGVYGFANMLAHIPAGYLADRIGRRQVMWAAWFLGLLAAWIMALADSLPFFVAGMWLYALTLFVVSPLNSYVSAASGHMRPERALTIVSAAFSLGMILGPVIGGAIGEAAGFRTIFILAGAIFIVSTAIILLIHPQPVERAAPQSSGNAQRSYLPYLAFLGINMLVVFALYLPQPLAPNYLQNQAGLSTSQIGSLYALSSIGVVVLNLVLGQMDGRLGYIIGQVSVGLCVLLLWRSPGLFGLGIAFLLLGGFRAVRVLSTAQIRRLVPSSNMGLSFGLAETASSLAMAAAPVLAGYLYAAQPASVFTASLVMIALALSATLAFFYFSNRSQRGSKQPQEVTNAIQLD